MHLLSESSTKRAERARRRPAPILALIWPAKERPANKSQVEISDFESNEKGNTKLSR